MVAAAAPITTHVFKRTWCNPNLASRSSRRVVEGVNDGVRRDHASSSPLPSLPPSLPPSLQTVVIVCMIGREINIVPLSSQSSPTSIHIAKSGICKSVLFIISSRYDGAQFLQNYLIRQKSYILTPEMSQNYRKCEMKSRHITMLEFQPLSFPSPDLDVILMSRFGANHDRGVPQIKLTRGARALHVRVRVRPPGRPRPSSRFVGLTLLRRHENLLPLQFSFELA